MQTENQTPEIALPIYWWNHAHDLHASAAALWFSMRNDQSAEIVRHMKLGGGFRMDAAIGSVFHMLCGLALEVLYKAVAVSKSKQINQSHHRLVDHATDAGVIVSQKEAKLLEILSEYIYWCGKYPTPKKIDSAVRLRRLSLGHLFDAVPLGRLTVHRPNKALDWSGFEEIWGKAVLSYESPEA